MAISIALFSDAWTDLFAVIFRLIRKKAPAEILRRTSSVRLRVPSNIDIFFNLSSPD